MTPQEAIDWIETRTAKPLSDLQQTILLKSWEKKTYKEISQETDYTQEYIKDTGYRLWKLLSKLLDKPVNKKNFKVQLEKHNCTYMCTDLSHNLQFCQPLTTFQGYTNWTASILFSHNNQLLLSGSIDGTIKIWEAKTGKCLVTLNYFGDDNQLDDQSLFTIQIAR